MSSPPVQSVEVQPLDPPKCAVCRDVGWVFKDEKREECACRVRLRVRTYLRHLEPLVPVQGLNPTTGLPGGWSNVLVLFEDKDILPQQVKWVFATLLLARGARERYRVLNAYELIDIYLENRAEKEGIHSCLDLREPILGVFYGFHEFTNKRQGEAFLQTADFRLGKGLITWLAITGTPPFTRELVGYCRQRKYTELSYDSSYHAAPPRSVSDLPEAASAVQDLAEVKADTTLAARYGCGGKQK